MKPASLLATAAIGFAASLPKADAALLISQYLEGASNDKAIELVNNFSTPITFDGDDQILVYFNGSSTVGTTITLDAITLLPGEVWVVADNDANANILAVTDQTSAASFWNGDDAIEILFNGAISDSFGQKGVDPGAQWSSGGVTTQDENLTLTALPLVDTGGRTASTDSFDPSLLFTANGLGTPEFGLGVDFSIVSPTIPEPGRAALLACGALGVFMRRRRR